MFLEITHYALEPSQRHVWTLLEETHGVVVTAIACSQ